MLKAVEGGVGIDNVSGGDDTDAVTALGGGAVAAVAITEDMDKIDTVSTGGG